MSCGFAGETSSVQTLNETSTCGPKEWSSGYRLPRPRATNRQPMRENVVAHIEGEPCVVG